MKKKIAWVVVSGLMVLSLVLASCAPTAKEEVAPAAKEEVAPAAKEEVAPVVEEVAPAEKPGMVKVSWKKGDGTMVEKLIEKPRYGGVHRWYRETAILSFDEAYQAPWTTGQELSYTNEELIQGEWPRGPICTNEVGWVVGGWMRESKSMGCLAESWEFPDAETAIFHIRKGVRWALNPASEASRLVNGREFTAHDAVFNIKRIYMDLKTSTMYGMAGISRPADVYATDKYTVVVKSPPGQLGNCWEYVADWTRMVAPEVCEKYGSQNKWENVVGTGPFMIVDYVPMSVITFARNPNYWMKDPLIPENQLPYVDGLKEFIIPDKSTLTAAIRTGKVDSSILVEYEDAQSVLINPEIKSYETISVSFALLGWRVDKPELPFKDIRVRRALLMAIDQPEIIDTYHYGKGVICHQTVHSIDIFKGIATPTDQLPPAPDGFDNKKLYTRVTPEKLAEAKKLLAEAGYPDGFTYSVTLYNMARYMDLMSIAKDMWSKIGVTLELDVKEYGTYMSIYQRKTHPYSLICGRWSGDPHLTFCCRTGNMYNWGMVSVPAFDAYYDQMNALYFNEPERDKVLRAYDLATIDYVPYYVPPLGTQYYFWWPWVKNYSAEQSLGLANNYVRKYIWIDQELKKAMGY